MRIVRFVSAVILVALLIALFRYEQHWIAVHLGILKAGPDPYYNFWSGFGSDLTEATILVAIAGAWRHHNCHQRWCPLLGRPMPDQDGVPTPYLACHLHHPDHKGKGRKRSVSKEELHRAHQSSRR